MPEWAEPYLTAANPAFYPMTFTLLLLAGLGAPISADLVVLTIGYVVYTGNASFFPAAGAIIAGILLSDTGMFFIGGTLGLKLSRIWPFKNVLTPERIARAEESYEKYGYKIVFAARFMPGIRTVFMFTSGLLRLKYWKFISYDVAGALIVVPLTLLSVTWVAGNKDAILVFMHKFQWAVLAIAVAFLVIYFTRRRRKRILLTESVRTGSDPSYPER